MIPSQIIRIAEIPSNRNGKLDTNRLMKKLDQFNACRTNIEYASTETENNIQSFLINLLKLDSKKIDMNKNFFELGGDSLLAISLTSFVEENFHVTISAKEIFDADTIKYICKIIDDRTSFNIESSSILPIPKTQLNCLPMSSAQRRIYYACKLIGNNNLVYNAPGAILIDALLDKEKVEQAFKKIIQNQSSFRTIFVSDGEEIKQQILDTVNFNVDISYNTEKDIDDILKTFSKPFDLEKAPLLRVSLCYIDNKKTLLLLDSHHIIMDGVSLEILIRDFFNAYNQHSLNKLPLEYKDYSVYEKEFFKSDTIKQSEKYWLNRFKNFDFESLNLPYDYTLPANRGYIGNKIYNTIEPTLFDKVNNFAKEMQVSPYIVFLTSLFITLYKYTGQPDIVIGSPVANRTIPETKDIIGMFVNNIAIRAKVPTNKTVYTFLQKLKKIVAEDLENQSYPYDLLVKKLQVPVDNSKNLYLILF